MKFDSVLNVVRVLADLLLNCHRIVAKCGMYAACMRHVCGMYAACMWHVMLQNHHIVCHVYGMLCENPLGLRYSDNVLIKDDNME